MCFYHAERIPSAIAKFLVYRFGEVEGRAKIGEERGGRQWGGKEEGRKWECTKNSPNTQQVWHLGTPLGATAPCHTIGLPHKLYIFRKFFLAQHLPRK